MKTITQVSAIGLAFIAGALLADISYAGADSSAAGGDASEAAKNVIAAQLRRQGFSCDKAVSAERDTKDSKPDEAAWILTCENAVYRVRLVPNMAADVERVN